MHFDNLSGVANWSESSTRKCLRKSRARLTRVRATKPAIQKHSEVVVKLKKLLKTIVALTADDEQAMTLLYLGSEVSQYHNCMIVR